MIRVGIVMGSDSDLPVMRNAAAVLDELGVESELRIISAHRTPEEAASYAKTAEERGLRVIIAGAGGAAHLAGTMAAWSILPVIGVPIKSEALNGLDSLLSTAQMPSGVPVATVAIGGAKNAGILAAQILAIEDADLRERIREFKRNLAETVADKDSELQNDLI